MTDLELAYVIHELASEFFPAATYGSEMPEFQFDGPDAQAVARLESAINLPRQPYYRTIHEKAACLFRSLVKNHALKDGNKRLGVVALDVFLRINRVDFKATQDERVAMALAIAGHHGNFPLETITKWIRSGCAGRPRGWITSVAATWEQTSRATMTTVRRDDIKAGRRARIPGRRVRLTAQLQERWGPVTPVPGGKVTLQGGPRDGENADWPFRAEVGSQATAIHPDDIFLEGAQRRRVVYRATDKFIRRRRIATFVGDVPDQVVSS